MLPRNDNLADTRDFTHIKFLSGSFMLNSSLPGISKWNSSVINIIISCTALSFPQCHRFMSLNENYYTNYLFT